MQIEWDMLLSTVLYSTVDKQQHLRTKLFLSAVVKNAAKFNSRHGSNNVKHNAYYSIRVINTTQQTLEF